jgi:AcrR family transcriptional regulator
MRRSAKRDRYHHGDLRAALIDTAVELIAERGVQGFSLAEASRRLGVAVSAPYRHFGDRDELLVAAGVRACELLVATVKAESASAETPTERLTAAARGYVRFAAEHRAMFETVFGANLDRARHAELDEASRPVKDAFQAAALALSDGDPAAAEALAVAVATTAHGHAVMLHLGAFGRHAGAVEDAVARAGNATLALIMGRAALGGPRAAAAVRRPPSAGRP